MTARSYKELEQFDNESGDYDSLSYIPDEYRHFIGDFLITFSALEHALNLVISDLISDRAHDLGYRVVARLSVREKIDFLNEILLNFISVTGQDKKTDLKILYENLCDLNSFRNKVVHANWGTLKKDGVVRTKIVTDKREGFIKLESTTLTINGLREMCTKTDDLITKVDDFFMEAQNEALENNS